MVSEISIFELGENIANQRALYKLLLRLDEFYIPRISSQIDLKEYSMKLLKSARVFCAITNKKKYAGLLAIYVNDKVNCKAFISTIGVFPVYNGLGVSKALMLKAFEIAADSGMSVVLLEVNINNQRAVSFYKKLGFEEKNKDGNKIVMVKEI